MSYSFPPHSNNCVHSSESEITNCQSLHIPCSTCGLDRTTSDVLNHLFLRHGLVQVASEIRLYVEDRFLYILVHGSHLIVEATDFRGVMHCFLGVSDGGVTCS